MDIIIGIIVGFIAGIFSGILGIGGGTIAVPGMVLLLDTEQHIAQGVSLTALLLTAVVGTFVHYRQKNLDLKMVMWIAPTAVVFSILGSWAAGRVDADWLTRVFAIALLVIGCRMLLISRGGQGVRTG
ncbi:MAG TPA: sulfite exporter TauE/SafE family protein [Dehalococcoidia bacterium]|nr:sulfite exporter TauE/SafE family protein [Dehalococcoidia bacterium]